MTLVFAQFWAEATYVGREDTGIYYFYLAPLIIIRKFGVGTIT